MTTNVAFIVPFSNEEILKKWFLKSPVKEEEIIKLPIDKEHSAPKLINKFLSNLKGKQWLVFCEEWIRLLKNVEPILADRNKNTTYGITGARIRKEDSKLQIFDGRTGYNKLDNKQVDSLGQGCIAVHSSAIKKFNLKFDENFEEKYMVDFSLQCKVNGMKNCIMSVDSRFKERVTPFEEEEIIREKLRKKYSKLLPIGLFGGTLTDNSNLDLKTFLQQREDWLKTLISEKAQLTSKINDYEKSIDDLKNFDDNTKQRTDVSDSSIILEKELFDKLEKKIVWIFGTPRSGSTWLAHDILRKDRIKSLDETMFGAQLGAFYDNPAPHWAQMKGWHAKFERIVDRDKDDLFFSKKYENTWKNSLRLLILRLFIVNISKT